MKLKPKPLEIGNKTGFGEHDLFGRKDFAERLTNLVRNIEDPTVFLLDAKWGDGKTTFLKQWAGELRNTGIPVIEFDAFARDYQEDPFIALSAEIFAVAQKVESLEEETRANFIESAKSLGKASLSILTKIAISKITSGEMSLEDVKKLGEAPIDEVESIIEDRLKAAEADTKLLCSFREALEKLAKGMSNEEGKPLVLIIDELDRCRPSFAVELIEKIKHVFAVSGVHFVLSTHLPQLAKIFQNTHGLGEKEQALIYLEKFYNVRLRFPTPPPSSDRDTKLYIQHLLDEIQLPTGYVVAQIQEVLECVFQNRQISLRTIEKIMTNIALYYAGTSSGGGENVIFVSGVCCIRHLDMTLYDKIASSDVTLDDIDGFFNFNTWSQEGVSPTVGDWWRLLFNRLHDKTPKTTFDPSVVIATQDKANVLLPQITSHIDNFH